MSFKDARVTALTVTREQGNWFATLNGEKVGVDWDDAVFEREWDYTHKGVAGKVIFLDVHGGDDPYFSSQKDADKQLLQQLNLTTAHDFLQYLYAFDPANDNDEINLIEVVVEA